MIQRQKNGKYLARLHTRSAQVKRSFDRRVDADRWLADMRARNLHGGTVTASNLLVRDCMQQWREWVAEHRSASYQTACQTHGDPIVNWMVEHNVGRVDRLTLRSLDSYWRHCRTQGFAQQTIHNRCRTLIASLNWCVSRGIITNNPVKDYWAPARIVHNTPQVPSPDELQAIFDHLPNDDTRKAFWALLALGCRFGAFAALRREHVLASGRIDFSERVKGGLSYKRPLPEFPFELPERGYLFTNRGNQWNERTLISQVQRACTYANLAKITIHTLRHAFATYMLANGEAVGVVASLGGWRTLAMLDRYRDVSEDYISLLNEDRHAGYLPIWPEEQGSASGD